MAVVLGCQFLSFGCMMLSFCLWHFRGEKIGIFLRTTLIYWSLLLGGVMAEFFWIFMATDVALAIGSALGFAALVGSLPGISLMARANEIESRRELSGQSV
jgi:hypothetical protein